MTALQLLGYITAAMLLQAFGFAAVGLWRLAHRTPPVTQPDLMATRVQVNGAWAGWRDFLVTRREFEDAAQTQCSFYLEPVDGAPLPYFTPGQYLTLLMSANGKRAGESNSASPLTRCYSLSAVPQSKHYRITVKRMQAPLDRPDLPPGIASGQLLDRIHEGDTLQMKAPAGRFVLEPEPDSDVPVVLIAGGIGITPMICMLSWSVVAQPARVIHLFYGVRNSADHAFKVLLEGLALAHPTVRLHVTYASPAPDDVRGRDYANAGFVDLALLRSTLPHGRHQFYICGPPPMMQSLVSALDDWGVARHDIHFEAFGPGSVRPAEVSVDAPELAAPVEIRLMRSGRTLAWYGQDANLLDFVERHGVTVEAGCRSGSCGTCETRLVAGQVRYAHNPDFDISSGCCLLCVGKPRSALQLDV